MMNAEQCFLAVTAGATCVSLFCGSVNSMGYNSVEEIRKARQLIDQFGLKAKIIYASTREVLNVVEWLVAGSHIVTVLPRVLEDMVVHPYRKGDGPAVPEACPEGGGIARGGRGRCTRAGGGGCETGSVVLEPVNEPAR